MLLLTCRTFALSHEVCILNVFARANLKTFFVVILLIFLSSCSSGECYDMVSVSEAEKLAEKLGVLYQEVSAQTGDQVADAFEAAVKLGHTRRNQQGKLSQKISDKDSFDPTWIPPMSE